MHKKGNLVSFAAFDDKAGAGGFSIPKGQYHIRIGDDSQVPLQWGGAAVFFVVREKFGQLNAMGFGIFFGAGVRFM